MWKKQQTIRASVSNPSPPNGRRPNTGTTFQKGASLRVSVQGVQISHSMTLWGRTASWDILKVQTSCKLAPGTFGARWWDVHRRQPGMSPCPGTFVATSPCLSPHLSPSRKRWRGGKASLTTMRPACEVTEDIATPADCDFLSTTNVVQIDFILWLKIECHLLHILICHRKLDKEPLELLERLLVNFKKDFAQSLLQFSWLAMMLYWACLHF